MWPRYTLENEWHATCELIPTQHNTNILNRGCYEYDISFGEINCGRIGFNFGMIIFISCQYDFGFKMIIMMVKNENAILNFSIFENEMVMAMVESWINWTEMQF